MEQGELKKAFFKWLKGLRAYTPQELIDNSDHFSVYWSSWLRKNAYEIGKLDKDGKKKRREERKKRREKKAKKKEEEKEEEEKKEEYDVPLKMNNKTYPILSKSSLRLCCIPLCAFAEEYNKLPVKVPLKS